ncbi:MAG: mechanosensitive ion channel family protein [Myxococcales bacterium]|nr:mechanosensitive ion channel family protein [Myxococcales bacterium]
MEELLSVVLSTQHSLNGFGFVGVFTLLGVLQLILPEPDRKLLRVPLVLFAGYMIVSAGLLLVSKETNIYLLGSSTALLLVLLSFGRLSFLLVQRVALRTWWSAVPKIFLDIIQGLVYVVVLMVTLRTAGVELDSILTTSAVLTGVIGLSLQETLGNIFAGLSLQAQRPFEIDDWVEVDQRPNLSGTIVEINWRATRILTDDGIELVVPNGALAKVPLHNHTKPTPRTRRSIYVRAPFEVPPSQVHLIVLAALQDVSKILSVPGPSVVTHKFDEYGVLYWCRFYCETFHERWDIESAARDRIWYGFRRAGISIPYPTRVTHIQKHDAADGELAKQAHMRKCRQALGQVDFLKLLSEETLAQLASNIEIRLHGRDETIIRQGDVGDELFILHSGWVLVRVARAGVRAAEVVRLGPGRFFGEMSLMTGELRSATVVAVTDCELVVVGKAAFQEVLQSHAGIVERISHVLGERKGELERHKPSTGIDSSQRGHGKEVLIERIRRFFAL